MTRYLLAVDFQPGAVDTPMSEWKREEITAHLDYYEALHDELVASGELVDSTVLTGPDLAKIVSSDVSDLRGFGFNDRLSSFSVGNGGYYGSDGRIVRAPRGIEQRGPFAGANRNGWNQAQVMVRRSYQSVLGREPDPSGLQSWSFLSESGDRP